MDVVIYLSDNTGHQFTLHNGKSTPTSQLLQIMIATLKLPDVLAKKCFSLWLKSPLLDVQLKPQHIPFRMVKQWPMLIERFSMGTPLEKSLDEPALLFRRNAFLTLEDESKITDEGVLKVLQLEAKYNIQQGIYPCDEEDIEQLGALMCMDEQEDQQQGIQKIVRESMPTLVPNHMAKTKRNFISRQHSIEERIIQCAKKVSQEEAVRPVLEFMKICWQLPYYGSVIFNGLVERAQISTLTALFHSQTDIPVRVAINTNGVWIIDVEKKHVLIGLLYDEFNWQVTDIQADGTEETKVSSLFLEFDDAKTGENQLLGIISKEAPMMNSMIETCIAMRRDKTDTSASSSSTAEVDGSSSSSSNSSTTCQSSTRVRPLFQRQNSVTSNRTEKLNLKKIDEPCCAEKDVVPSATHKSSHSSTKRGILKRFGSKQKIQTPREEQYGLI